MLKIKDNLQILTEKQPKISTIATTTTLKPAVKTIKKAIAAVPIKYSYPKNGLYGLL